MPLLPPWLPAYDESVAVIAAGFLLLLVGLLAWSFACLRVALHGNWLAAMALQAGGTAVMWSALCGRQVLPMVRRPYMTSYYWAGDMWSHRDFNIFARDGLVWMAVGACLLVATVGLLATAPRPPMSEDGEGAP